MGEKKKCWACHYCNTESRLLLFPPPTRSAKHRRFPSRKKCSIATSTTGLCVECSKRVCVACDQCARAFFLHSSSSSFFSVGRPSRFGENGQRKRKIARFPCDRHPIEIGGTSSPMARPLPAPLVLLERGCVEGGRGTLKSEKLGAAVLPVVQVWPPCTWPSTVLPLFCVFCWCHAQKHPIPPSMVSLNELRTKKKPTSHCQPASPSSGLILESGLQYSFNDRLLRCY